MSASLRSPSPSEPWLLRGWWELCSAFTHPGCQPHFGDCPPVAYPSVVCRHKRSSYLLSTYPLLGSQLAKMEKDGPTAALGVDLQGQGLSQGNHQDGGGGGWNAVLVLKVSPSVSLVRVLRLMADTGGIKSWAWERSLGWWDCHAGWRQDSVVSAERAQRTKPLGWQRKEKPVKVTQAPPRESSSESQGRSCWGKAGWHY